MAQKNFFVKITLKGVVVEERTGPLLLVRKDQHSILSLLSLLDKARHHKRVRGLMLSIKNPTIGWGEIQEIHQSLERFHRAGKRSIAYLEQADTKSYYLACGAQSLHLPPSASLELVGLSAEIFFFKNLFDFLGVEPQLFRVGRYKAASEIFTRQNLSESNRQELDSIVGDIQRQLVEKIAARRGVQLQQVQEWIDRGPYTAREAATHELIDGIHYEDEVEKLFQQQEPELSRIPSRRLHAEEGFFKKLLTFYRPQIAYLVAEGLIVPGQSGRRPGQRPTVGAETLGALLRACRKRKKVKAVVLRINSSGGSALASDLIWRELYLTNQEKPVIISFGSVAASGGYYLATAARHILGMPATLTGSIGVIHGKFNLREALAKIGITVDRIAKGRHAGYSSPLRPFSGEEIVLIRKQMKEFYEELFLKKVAKSRGKSIDSIRRLAEGRLWTGAQAVTNGLIDRSGGLCEALELARQEAGLSKRKRFRVTSYGRRRSLRDLFSFTLAGEALEDQVLALMPEELNIR